MPSNMLKIAESPLKINILTRQFKALAKNKEETSRFLDSLISRTVTTLLMVLMVDPSLLLLMLPNGQATKVESSVTVELNLITVSPLLD